MAVVLYLVAIIGGVVVGDLVLENPTAGEVTVFNQPVSGYTEGTLLAMAAALGFVVAVLVASMNSTTRRRARRKQHRAISAGTQPQTTEPEQEQEQASLLEEFFRRQETLGEPAQPDELARKRGKHQTDAGRITVIPGPTEHHPGSFHQRTRRAAHPRDDPDLGFPPHNQHPR
jgi:hypothetical protein